MAEASLGDGRMVGSLQHGLQVLDLFDRDRLVVGVGEIATSLGLHRSTASRLASTLAACGYLEPAGAQGRYRLGARLASLGRLATASASVDEIGAAHLRSLSELTGETGHLAHLDGDQAVTAVVSEGWHTVRMHSWVGKRSPAHSSSMGKVLLAGLHPPAVDKLYPHGALERRTERTIVSLAALHAELQVVRMRGYAVDREELEPGLRCLAAPVHDATGEVVASISISGPTSRLKRPAERRLAAQVMWAAGRVSAALGAPVQPQGWPRRPQEPPAPDSRTPRG